MTREIGGLALVFCTVVAGCGSEDPVQPDPRAPSTPTGVSTEVVAWLQDHAVAFSTDDPEAPLTDLEPLRALVGNARVVALGEATHGTREFFRMKHRLLRFLVTEMGFQVFSIEATMPEAFRVNSYVHGGPGDPAVLLSGLYFWTWNTESVLDMIRWMRTHNAAPGAGPPVDFTGFDMQYPGMAIHNVEQFLREQDPDGLDYASERFDCVRPYANGPDGFRDPELDYGTVIPALRDSCRDAITEVEAYLVERLGTLAQTSSPEAVRDVVQNARLVIQWESLESGRPGASRDRFMAENALWLLERAGPDAKMVIWAHNLHVRTNEQGQGQYLREVLGDRLVTVGLDFGHGAFTAGTLLEGGGFGPIQPHTVGSPPDDSYEFRFAAARLPRFVLDLRGRGGSGSDSEWLAGPRSFRSVGSGFAPANPEWFFVDLSLPAAFDLVAYFDETTASHRLPFVYPDSFDP